MFRRRRKSKAEGLECPLCNLVNPTDTAECIRCYYILGKSGSQQGEAVSENAQTGLLDELMSESATDDTEEEQVIDWTNHSFAFDDMAVEVSQYVVDSEEIEVQGEAQVDREIEVPSAVTVERPAAKTTAELIEAAPEPTREMHPPDVPPPLDSGSDADPVVLEAQTQDPLPPSIPSIELPSSVTASAGGSAPTSTESDYSYSSSTTPPESSSAEVSTAPVDEDRPADTSTAQKLATAMQAVAGDSNGGQAEAPPKAIPVPTIPSQAGSNGLRATPSIPSISTQVDSDSADEDIDLEGQDETSVSAEEEVPNVSPPGFDDRIWPWPQTEPLEGRELRRKLREAMESAKSGDTQETERRLDAIGPQLGDNLDLLFHVGVLLKKLNRDVALRQMLEAARRLHPDDKHVATALTSLGM